MKDDSALTRERRGFVDPLYMILLAAVGLGLALASPIVGAWLGNELILLWHWLCLGAGVAVLAACVWFIVREHKQ
jgi:hypothetical protein